MGFNLLKNSGLCSSKVNGESHGTLGTEPTSCRIRKKIVTTSWDDGYKLDLRVAELLEKYSMKGTFYIPKKYKYRTLTDEEIREIDVSQEVGAHGLSHIDLTTVPLPRAMAEIAGSKLFLEELLEHRINMFCYPWGRYNSDICRLVREAGFQGARTINTFEASFSNNPFEIKTSMNVFPHPPYHFIKRALKMKRLHTLRAIFSGWDVVAMRIFDHVNRYGGVWHLWGHSSDIEEYSFWNKLKEVFKYVSNRDDVIYCSNGELISFLGWY
jgi:peptidoglycan/xylan/chitin deacetylase (PgdA/CDA1 family)